MLAGDDVRIESGRVIIQIQSNILGITACIQYGIGYEPLFERAFRTERLVARQKRKRTHEQCNEMSSDESQFVW